MIDHILVLAGPIVVVVVVLVALLEGYHYLKTKQSQPSAAPATVGHVAALQNDIKAVAAKIETSNVVNAIKQRVEDLHTKLDKREKEGK